MKATTIKPDTKSGLQFHLPISSSTMIVSCTLVMTFMEIWRLSRLFRFKKIDKSSLIRILIDLQNEGGSESIKLKVMPNDDSSAML